jgi:hypothetical protein
LSGPDGTQVDAELAMTLASEIVRIALVGVGATAIFDAWVLVLRGLGVATLPMALLGRWVGHLAHGRFAHVAIARAAAIPGERAWGWLAHYAIGVAFALLLVAVQGLAWMDAPTLLPALAVGLATAVFPLCVMQPAMGAGFASSKTPAPLRNSLRSVVNHTVFGAALYLAALIVVRMPG